MNNKTTPSHQHPILLVPILWRKMCDFFSTSTSTNAYEHRICIPLFSHHTRPNRTQPNLFQKLDATLFFSLFVAFFGLDAPKPESYFRITVSNALVGSLLLLFCSAFFSACTSYSFVHIIFA